MRPLTPARAPDIAFIDKPDVASTIETMQVAPLRNCLVSWLALSAVSACSTPLGVHADAGRDVGQPDAAPDAVPDAGPDVGPDAPQDLPSPAPDLGAIDFGVGGDERQRGGVPKGFRFDNQSDHTVYISRILPVSCAEQSPAGLVDCNFFPLPCGMRCSEVTNPQACCTLCIGFPSSLYVIAPGKSQFVAWSGTTHAKVSNICADCACNQESPASTGTVFQASIAVYTEYSCNSEPCVASDAGVMEASWPAGTPTTYTVNFGVPYLGDEIVFVIPGQPRPDAAVADVAALDEAVDRSVPVDSASKESYVDGAVGPTDAPPCHIYTSDCRGARCEVPLDWNEALTGLSWANAIRYFGYSVVLCHTGKGYDQAIGSQQTSLGGPYELRDVYLYDALTGKFVQRIRVGDPATQSVGCVLRAADAPEVAITDAPLTCEKIVRFGKQDADVTDL